MAYRSDETAARARLATLRASLEALPPWTDHDEARYQRLVGRRDRLRTWLRFEPYNRSVEVLLCVVLMLAPLGVLMLAAVLLRGLRF